MTVLTGPVLLKGLEEAYQKAPKCNGARRLRARDSLCGFDAFFEIAAHLEAMPEVQNAIGKRSLVKSTDLLTFFKYTKITALAALGAYIVTEAFQMFTGTVSYLMMTWKLRHSDGGVRLPPILKVPLRLQDKVPEIETDETSGCILKETDPKVRRYKQTLIHYQLTRSSCIACWTIVWMQD